MFEAVLLPILPRPSFTIFYGIKKPQKKLSRKHLLKSQQCLRLIREQRKERAVIVPFLIFLWLLSFHQGKESDNAEQKVVCKNAESLNLQLKPLGCVLATGLLPLVSKTAAHVSQCLRLRLAPNRKMSFLQELVFEVGDRKKGRLYYELKSTKEVA